MAQERQLSLNDATILYDKEQQTLHAICYALSSLSVLLKDDPMDSSNGSAISDALILYINDQSSELTKLFSRLTQNHHSHQMHGVSYRRHLSIISRPSTMVPFT